MPGRGLPFTEILVLMLHDKLGRQAQCFQNAIQGFLIKSYIKLFIGFSLIIHLSYSPASR